LVLLAGVRAFLAAVPAVQLLPQKVMCVYGDCMRINSNANTCLQLLNLALMSVI